jgi:peroxiredoxin (alkyl hydroperoxide reductase subunit C)
MANRLMSFSAAAAVALCVCAMLCSVRAQETYARVRAPAPDWKAKAVIQQKFTDVKLSDYKGQWFVLLFYPFDFTFVCPTEIIAFSKAKGKFAALNTNIAAISTDSHHTHLAWIRTPREHGGLGTDLDIPLIADVSKSISRRYGILIEDPEDGMYGAALRGLYIIDPKGVIRSMTINDDQVGRSVDETLRLIQAFQYSDSHDGEVCPANWKKGDATIKANHDDKVEFFKAKFGN